MQVCGSFRDELISCRAEGRCTVINSYVKDTHLLTKGRKSQEGGLSCYVYITFYICTNFIASEKCF